MTVSPHGLATVYGPGVVCIVDAAAAAPTAAAASGARPGGGAERRLTARARALSLSGLQLHVLAAGDRFDLRARRVVRD